MQNLHIAFLLQLAFVKNILDMLGNYRAITLKQLRHLVLRQSDCILLKGNVSIGQATISLIYQNRKISRRHQFVNVISKAFSYKGSRPCVYTSNFFCPKAIHFSALTACGELFQPLPEAGSCASGGEHLVADSQEAQGAGSPRSLQLGTAAVW